MDCVRLKTTFLNSRMYISQRDVCTEYQTHTLHMIDSLHVYTIENTHCKPILNKKNTIDYHKKQNIVIIKAVQVECVFYMRL